MPLIYPPTLRDLYANTFSVTSSIMRTAPPEDFLLESDGNGATFWTSVLGCNAGVSTLYVSESLTANRAFVDYLSANVDLVSTNNHPVLIVSSLTLSTLTANSGFIDMLSTSSTFTNSLRANSLYSESFNTNNISTVYYKGSNYNSTSIVTNSISSINIFSKLVEIEQSTLTNYLQASTISSGITSINSANVINFTNAFSIQTSTLSADIIEGIQISTIDLKVSTINGLNYPPEAVLSQNLQASTLFAKDHINTSLTNTTILSTTTLFATSVNTDILQLNIISTNKVNTQVLSVDDLRISTFQTQSTVALLANFDNFITNSITSFSIKTQETIGSNARIQSIHTSELYGNSAQFEIGKTVFISTANLYVGEFSTSEPVERLNLSSLSLNTGEFVTSSIQTQYLSSGFQETSLTFTDSLYGQYISSVNLNTDILNVSSIYLESLSTNSLSSSNLTITLENTQTISTGLLYGTIGFTSTLNTIFLSSQLASAVNPSNFESTFIGNLFTSSITVPYANINAISSVYVSTSSIELNYINSSTLTANSISSLYGKFSLLNVSFINASIVSSLVSFANEAYFNSISTNTLSTGIYFTTLGEVDNTNAQTIYTNVLETIGIEYPSFTLNSLSTIFANATNLKLSSLIANEINALNLEANTISTFNATITKYMYTSSYVTNYYKTTEFKANTFTINDLYISSLEGDSYPPPLPFPSNLTLSSVIVAETTNASTIFVEYLSTTQLAVGLLNAYSTFIGEISSVNSIIEYGIGSTIVAESISTNSAFIEHMNIKQLNTSTLSTTSFKSENTEISSIFSENISTLFLETSFINTSSLITNQISTINWQGQYHQGFILDAESVSSGILNIDQIDLEKFSAKILSTIFISTQDIYISSILLDSVFAISTTYTSSFLNQLSTPYVSSSEAYVGSVNLNSAIANSFSTGQLIASTLIFSSINTEYLSSSLVEGSSAFIFHTDINNASTLNLFSDSFYISSLNVNIISTNTTSLKNTYTSSLELELLSVGRLIVLESRISSIFTDQISTGFVYGQGFISSLVTDNLNISSFTANTIFVSSISNNYISSQNLETTIANISTLHTNTIINQTTSIENLYVNSTLQTDIFSTNFLSTNNISTFWINAQYIRAYTVDIYGGNTLNVSGSSIFDGIIVTESQFLAKDIEVSTLKYITLYPNGAIFTDFNTNILNSSTLKTKEILTNNLSANYIETPQFEASIVSVSSLTTSFVSTLFLDGSSTIISSLFVGSATTIGRLEQVPFISSLVTESLTANIQSMNAESIYTSTLFSDTVLTSTLNTHFLSAANILVPSNGIANILQTNSISTSSLILNEIKTESTNAFIVSTTEFQAISTDSYISSINFQQFSTQYLNVNNATGLGFSTFLVSTNTLLFGDANVNTISTNEVSTTSVRANNVIIDNILNTPYFSTGAFVGTIESAFASQIFSDNLSTNFVSSHSVFVNLLNMSTLSTTILNANTLETVDLVANISTNFYTSLRNRFGTLNVNFVSTGIVNAPGSSFIFGSTFTSSLKTQFAMVSNLILEDSLLITNLVSEDIYAKSINLNTMNISSISSATVAGISTGTVTFLSTNFLSTGTLQGATNSEFLLGSLSTQTLSTIRAVGKYGESQNLITGQISTGRLFAGDTVINALSTNNLNVGSLNIQSVTANLFNTNSISSGILQNTPNSITFDLTSTTSLSTNTFNLVAEPGMYFQIYSGNFQQTTFSNSIDNSYYFDVYSGLYGSRIVAGKNGYVTDFTNIISATNNLCNADAFSYLWTGYFIPKQPGNYTFTYYADNSGRFWIGDTIKPKSAYPFSSPLNISGLFSWFDSSDSNTVLDSSSNTMTPGSGSRVKYWLDKSGNNRIASNVDSVITKYPTWSNDSILGKPIINFTASSSQLLEVNSFTYPFDIYVVTRPANLNTTQKDIFSFGSSNSDNLRALILHTGTILSNGSTAGANNFTSPLTETSLGYRLIRWTQATNCNSIWQNGIPLNNTTATWTGPPTSTGRFRIGTRSPNIIQTTLTYDGNFCEILIYNRLLSNPERFSVETYLSQKWGITIAGSYSAGNQAGGGGGGLNPPESYTITCNLQANTNYPLRIQLANNPGTNDLAQLYFRVTSPTGAITCNLSSFVNTASPFKSTITNLVTLDTRFSTIQNVQYGNFQQLSTLFLSTGVLTAENYFVTTLSTSAVSSIVTTARIFNASNINTIGQVSSGLLQLSNIQANTIFTETLSSQSLSSSSLFISSLQNASFIRGTRLFANELTVTGSVSTLSNVTSLVNTNILNVSSFSNVTQRLVAPGDIIYRNFINYNANDLSPNTIATNAITTRTLNTGPIITNIFNGIQINNLSSTTDSLPDLQLGDWGIYFREAPNTTFTNRLESLEDGFMFNSTLFVHQTSNFVGINTKVTGTSVSTFSLNIEGNLRVSGQDAYKPTGGPWIGASDKRVKTDIIPADLDRCYEINKSLSMFDYNFIEEYCKAYNIQDKRITGFIAQHVSTYFPNAVDKGKILWLEDGLRLNTNQVYFANYGALQTLISSFDTINKTISTFSIYPSAIEKSEQMDQLGETLKSSYLLFETAIEQKKSTLEGLYIDFHTLKNSYSDLLSYASTLLQTTKEKTIAINTKVIDKEIIE